MMTHDKIKAAARARMAATGESYTVARRAVVREHQAAIDRQTHESGSSRKGFTPAPAQLKLAPRARVLDQLTGITGISKQLDQLVKRPGHITLPPSSS
jgi:hypothetical protein